MKLSDLPDEIIREIMMFFSDKENQVTCLLLSKRYLSYFWEDYNESSINRLLLW